MRVVSPLQGFAIRWSANLGRCPRLICCWPVGPKGADHKLLALWAYARGSQMDGPLGRNTWITNGWPLVPREKRDAASPNGAAQSKIEAGTNVIESTTFPVGFAHRKTAHVVSPLQGSITCWFANPGRCPGLICCWPFGPKTHVHPTLISQKQTCDSAPTGHQQNSLGQRPR